MEKGKTYQNVFTRYQKAPLTIHESQGCMTPVLGRTKYFLGEVVLTYRQKKKEHSNHT